MLRNLLSGPEPLPAAACFTLPEGCLGETDCLCAIASDATEPGELRQTAQGAFRKRRYAEREELLEVLKVTQSAGYREWAGDSRSRFREELETLLLSDCPSGAAPARP